MSSALYQSTKSFAPFLCEILLSWLSRVIGDVWGRIVLSLQATRSSVTRPSAVTRPQQGSHPHFGRRPRHKAKL